MWIRAESGAGWLYKDLDLDFCFSMGVGSILNKYAIELAVCKKKVDGVLT